MKRSGLFQPTNLCVDQQGRIIVSDTGGFAVKIFDGEGNHLQTFGELGVTPGSLPCRKELVWTARAGFMCWTPRLQSCSCSMKEDVC